MDESKEETPETVRHGTTSVHHVPGRVPVDAAAQERPTTSLVTASVHLRPIPMNKCIPAVNLAQQSPEDTKRLFSEPTALSQKSCYIECERCLGLNNSLVDINLMKISRKIWSLKFTMAAVSKTTTSFCSEMSHFPHDTVQTLVMSKINTSMSPEELFITELYD